MAFPSAHESDCGERNRYAYEGVDEIVVAGDRHGNRITRG
jgi:hypothetical protein